jgi:hypothetical protein
VFLGALAARDLGIGIPWSTPDAAFEPGLAQGDDVVTANTAGGGVFAASHRRCKLASLQALVCHQARHRTSGLGAVSHRPKTWNPNEIITPLAAIPKEVDRFGHAAAWLVGGEHRSRTAQAMAAPCRT